MRKSTQAKVREFKRLHTVALPLHRWQDEATIRVSVGAPIFFSRAQIKKQGRGDGAILLRVFDLATGERMQLVLDPVLRDIFQETYPSEDYVGRSFEICRHAKKPGARRYEYDIYEIGAVGSSFPAV